MATWERGVRGTGVVRPEPAAPRTGRRAVAVQCDCGGTDEAVQAGESEPCRRCAAWADAQPCRQCTALARERATKDALHAELQRAYEGADALRTALELARAESKEVPVLREEALRAGRAEKAAAAAQRNVEASLERARVELALGEEMWAAQRAVLQEELEQARSDRARALITVVERDEQDGLKRSDQARALQSAMQSSLSTLLATVSSADEIAHREARDRARY